MPRTQTGAFSCVTSCPESYTTEPGLSKHQQSCKLYKEDFAKSRQKPNPASASASQSFAPTSESSKHRRTSVRKPKFLLSTSTQIQQPVVAAPSQHSASSSSSVQNAPVAPGLTQENHQSSWPFSSNSPSTESLMPRMPTPASPPLPPIPVLSPEVNRLRAAQPRRSAARPLLRQDILPQSSPAVVDNVESSNGSPALEPAPRVRRVILIVRDMLKSYLTPFCLFRLYPRQPTYDPDMFISVDDLAKNHF
ncbi:hypothetical protein EV360DRAFT_75828 [Lentinula raphanica]|nr:hypothetical protein EV360DRAFT_75828 [Lentinula raphanica]